MKLFRALAVALLLMLPSFSCLAGEPAQEQSPEMPIGGTDGTIHVGDMAPDFHLTTLNGKPMALSEFGKNRITLIVFWSYFCFPCQAEMPELQAFYEEVGQEVAMATIALDGHQYDNYILPFIADKKLTIPIAYDRETDKFYETAEKYGVLGTPTLFLLDDTGRIRFINLGRMDKSVLKSMIQSVKSKSFCSDIVKPPVGDRKQAK